MVAEYFTSEKKSQAHNATFPIKLFFPELKIILDRKLKRA
jgi:hypothetical protein